jgi:Ca-activated chloride channel homolog
VGEEHMAKRALRPDVGHTFAMSTKRNRRANVTATWLLATCAICGLGAAQTPTFRALAELVTLSVTVTDGSGRHVGDLSAADFVVFEDSRPQQLTFFSRANAGLSVSLLLDSSSSMEHQMALTQKAAMEFVARLRPDDVAEVVDFDSRVEVVQPPTNDRAKLSAAIQQVTAGGATALYNAVYITLRQNEKIKAQHADEVRRQVIIVLSDGDDTSSLVTFDQLLDLAMRSQTVIYTISLRADGALASSRTGLKEEGDFILKSLSQATGGRLLTAKQGSDLSTIYNQIADELTSQYVLGYLSNNPRRDGGWRRIAVRVQRPALSARTRLGYYAPAQ